MLGNIHERVCWMKHQAGGRDSRMETIRRVRNNDLTAVDPAAFSDLFPMPVVSNAIANSATDFMNSVAPLPAINCAAGTMRTEADKRRAAKKNKAVDSYWRTSRMSEQMFKAADQYGTYGLAVFYVEPDFEAGSPHIYVEDSRGAYFLRDRKGRVTALAKCWKEKRGTLRALFPDVPGLVGKGGISEADAELEVIRYCDDDIVLLYVHTDGAEVPLRSYRNTTGQCLASVAELPSLDGDGGGRYDGAVGPMLAHNRMRMYIIEAAEKSVHAPTWVDPSVQELPVGPDAIIQSDQPPQRVALPVPQDVFVTEQSMGSEVRVAAHHPSVRDGMTNASVVTGKGVEALMGQFDGDIKAAQVMLGAALERINSLALMVDEKYFGKTAREIQGTLSGESYQETWLPGKDIAGNYTCSVDYGFAAGLGAGQAVVLMLQLMGAGLISLDTVRRNSPIAMDVAAEQRHIETEKLQGALLQGFEALASALPQMAAQGQDVSDPIRKLASIIQLRGKGKSLEDAAAEVFAPPEAETPAENTAEGGQEEAPGGAPGGAPAQGELPAPPDAGPPDLMNLIAGIRNGKVMTGTNIQRKTPV